MLSSPQAWFAGLVHDAEVVVLGPAPSWGGARWPGHLLLRGHCPHELAYAVLCGLIGHFRTLGRSGQARRAAQLRLLLPLGEQLLARARSELRELDEAEPRRTQSDG